jgi:hypothetical protein
MPVIAALETISATRLGPCQESITFFQDKPISSNPGAQNAISIQPLRPLAPFPATLDRESLCPFESTKMGVRFHLKRGIGSSKKRRPRCRRTAMEGYGRSYTNREKDV